MYFLMQLFVCPWVLLCSKDHVLSSLLICPPSGRNWTSRVKGEPLLLSCMSRSLSHLSLVRLACPWNYRIWISLSFCLHCPLSASSVSVMWFVYRCAQNILCTCLMGHATLVFDHAAELDHIPEGLLSSSCSSPRLSFFFPSASSFPLSHFFLWPGSICSCAGLQSCWSRLCSAPLLRFNLPKCFYSPW